MSDLRAYFALAFAISWGGALLAEGAGGDRVHVFLAMIAGPSLASLALQGTRGLRDLVARLGRWRLGWRWWAMLLVAPACLAAVLAALALASPSFAPSRPSAAVAASAFAGGLVAGLFEELGWTGFATPRLVARFGWRRGAVWLGILWAGWHGLADFLFGARYGALWLPHFLEWFVALTAFRVLMTWCWTRTGSLLLAVLLHASFTGSQLLLWPAASPRAELLWYGLYALALWLAAALLSRPRVAATRDERARPMPGDRLVTDPMLVVTHAITIEAPPARVWPWLAQMGAGRAGWYSWDAIDNDGAPSLRRVAPELQAVAAGDLLPALPGAAEAFVVAVAEPPRDLVLTVPGAGGSVVSWEHLLEPLGPGRTRMIVRARVARSWGELARRTPASGRPIERAYRGLGGLPAALLLAVGRAGHRVMEARHMRGIQRRAEAPAH
jgi:membrane protease YdiL (CAAX protease family)